MIHRCPQCKKFVWPWQKKFYGDPIPGNHRKCGIEATMQDVFARYGSTYSMEKIKETWIEISPEDREIVNGLRT